MTDSLEADTEQGCTIGDGFVEAPDGTRAGLVWNVGPEPRFAVIEEPDGPRRGVFHFVFLQPIASVDELTQAFQGIVPVLDQLYRRCHAPPEAPRKRRWWEFSR